ncbi:MAG: hypothetical protein U5L03_10020 [Burkholderiaceae bacterium]|nr:hypothetical protein [Burkholderiaceae bacterium]
MAQIWIGADIMAALAVATLALERGEEALLPRQRSSACQRGLRSRRRTPNLWPLGSGPPCRSTLLGTAVRETSFNKVLPLAGPQVRELGEWARMRKIFIASLHRRSRAEVELWPSPARRLRARVLE